MPIQIPDEFARGPIGTLVANRYEIVSVIGRGGQGLVCRGLDRQTGQAVAVKILSGARARDAEAAARFEREQQALLALAGSHVVRVYERWQSETGAMYLVMELLEGRDLGQRLTEVEGRQQFLSLTEIRETIGPIVETLQDAHTQGIFHRDLKPGNIFLLAGGGVRLLDFGFARLRASEPLTAAGIVMGSPSYIAPEMWRGRPDEIDHRVDVYSLGVILFRMLAGRVPFAADSLGEMLLLTTTATRPSLHRLRPDLPAEIDHWAEQALAILPEHRFRTVRGLYNALWTVLEPEPRRASSAPPKSRFTAALASAARAVRRWTSRDDAAGWKQRAVPVAPSPAFEVAPAAPPSSAPATPAVPTSGPSAAPAPVSAPVVTEERASELTGVPATAAAVAPPSTGTTQLLIQSDYRPPAEGAAGEPPPVSSGVTELLVKSDYRLNQAIADFERRRASASQGAAAEGAPKSSERPPAARDEDAES